MFFNIINSIEDSIKTNNVSIDNETFYGLNDNDLHDLKIICDLSDQIQDNKIILYLITLFLFSLLYFINYI